MADSRKEKTENMEEEIHIIELLDLERLQRLLDNFSSMTGLACHVTDQKGAPITDLGNFTDFCLSYTRESEVGRQRCEWCDRYGAEEAWKSGCPNVYFCHAGLIDFSAPILARGRLVGCITGGQVLTSPPHEDRIRRLAAEIGADPDKYWQAAKKIPVVPKAQIDQCSHFLHSLSETISYMAYSRYEIYRSKRQVEKASREIEKAANMKSDFLANMSHEIRTPMNAVIGMAEMALREELPPAARGYLNQIKSSGHNLLGIINDILDFSKIESGKMDIIPVDYEAMSIVHDVANMVMTRLDGKNVELLIDLNPELPRMLLGDNIRIQQVLLNLANNAAKFTEIGSVTISLDFKWLDEENIEFLFAVTDTGLGIKKLDLDRLFKSFQQVDSKRNRNVEGTGLGLAISQRLLRLMNGKIFVESEYEKGSTFSFKVPQKVLDKSPSIKIQGTGVIIAYVHFKKKILEEHLKKDLDRFGIQMTPYEEVRDLEKVLLEDQLLTPPRRQYVFVDESGLNKDMTLFLKAHPGVTGVAVLDFYSTTKLDIPNLKIMRKPIYSMNLGLLFNNQELRYTNHGDELADFDFTAPEARALIVDDNAINVTVAVGLMEPLEMQIDSALSGKTAIERLTERRYDIIFMDHMMPEMDGVETTRIIRRLYPDYADVPILALTANAVDGTKEMFLEEGMNDFIAKPIELRTLIAKIKQWLPPEKIRKGAPKRKKNSDSYGGERLEIGDLDTDYALKLLGGKKLYLSVLSDYYASIKSKTEKIRRLEEEENWPEYTVEVHALKSASRQIGAMALADLAAEMEKAGNAQDVEAIKKHTSEMLWMYQAYEPVIEPFVEERKKDASTATKGEATKNMLLTAFINFRQALEDLDMDRVEAFVQELKQYSYSTESSKYLAALVGAAEEFDMDTCEEVLENWEGFLMGKNKAGGDGHEQD